MTSARHDHEPYAARRLRRAARSRLRCVGVRERGRRRGGGAGRTSALPTVGGWNSVHCRTSCSRGSATRGDAGRRRGPHLLPAEAYGPVTTSQQISAFGPLEYRIWATSGHEMWYLGHHPP